MHSETLEPLILRPPPNRDEDAQGSDSFIALWPAINQGSFRLSLWSDAVLPRLHPASDPTSVEHSGQASSENTESTSTTTSDYKFCNFQIWGNPGFGGFLARQHFMFQVELHADVSDQAGSPPHWVKVAQRCSDPVVYEGRHIHEQRYALMKSKILSLWKIEDGGKKSSVDQRPEQEPDYMLKEEVSVAPSHELSSKDASGGNTSSENASSDSASNCAAPNNGALIGDAPDRGTPHSGTPDNTLSNNPSKDNLLSNNTLNTSFSIDPPYDDALNDCVSGRKVLGGFCKPWNEWTVGLQRLRKACRPAPKRGARRIEWTCVSYAFTLSEYECIA